MSTKNLARKLGLLRQRSKSSSESKKSVLSNQTFSYLIVIDFESTCWRERNNYSQEIIEFPAVLLNTSTGEVESEFHTYVQPQEHPVLSEFCTELTGITQVQVEAGIPLHICLSRFNRWLQSLQLEKGVVFSNKQQTCSVSSPSQKLCTFLTWSDWDLGVCLQYECKRKQLHKPEVLNHWIDLRSTYRLFYNRKPKGLNGALQDLGIQFSGREHSGLDDSRNTAHLAARMMRDGCIMKITRSLERTSLKVKSMFGKTTENKKTKEDISKKENGSTSNKTFPFKIPFKASQKRVSSEVIIKDSIIKNKLSVVKESLTCQSLVSPRTLLNVAPMHCGNSSSVGQVTANFSSTAMLNSTSLQTKSSHVLCPIAVSCILNQPQPNTACQTRLEDSKLVLETEERCGSYDDVVLEGDMENISDFDSGCYDWEGSHTLHSNEDDLISEYNTRNNSEMQNATSSSSIIGKSVKISNTHSDVETKEDQYPAQLRTETCFALPKPVNWRKSNQCRTSLKISPQLQRQCDGFKKSDKTRLFGSVDPKVFVPERTSTPNISSRAKPVITKRMDSFKPLFTINAEPANHTAESSNPSCDSLHTTNNILSSLSTNKSFSAYTSLCSLTTKGPQKITSPLCECGRRAKRQLVSNGGPNHGRVFFCCPLPRLESRGRRKKGCGFFKWESALIKRSITAPVESYVSLCRNYSTLTDIPTHSEHLRKSY